MRAKAGFASRDISGGRLPAQPPTSISVRMLSPRRMSVRPLDTRAPPVPYVTSKHRLDFSLGQAIKVIFAVCVGTFAQKPKSSRTSVPPAAFWFPNAFAVTPKSVTS